VRWFPQAVLALVVALGGACSETGGGGQAAGSTTTAAAGAGAPARRVVESKADGFSVEIPTGWKDILLDTATLNRVLVEAGEGKLDQAVANQVRTLAGRGGRLLAYDDAKRTTNLQVLKFPSSPGVTTEQLVKDLPAQLQQAGLANVTVEMVTTAGGPAAKATGVQAVEGGGGKQLLQLQYWVVSGPSTFAAVLGTDDPPRDQATLEAIGQTFKLLQ
jgi:hypothetical protein